MRRMRPKERTVIVREVLEKEGEGKLYVTWSDSEVISLTATQILVRDI